MFELNYSRLDLLSNDSANWDKLIPCYVEYALCHHPHSDRVLSQVYEKLVTITEASAKAKSIFIQSITYSEDWSPKLHSIFVAICQKPFSNNPNELLEMSSYLQLKKSNLSTNSIISLLNSIFIHNGYNLSNYASFFQSFDTIQGILATQTDTIYAKFVYYFTQPGNDNLAFSLGLFEYMLSLSLSDSLDIHETPDFSILIIKVLTVYINPNSIELLCFLSFIYMNQLFYNEKQKNDILNLLYQSYPETLYKVANSVLSDSSLHSMWQLAKLIINHIDELKKKRMSYNSIPDLYPSSQRQETLRKSILDRNKRINKKANEESFFAQFFTTKHMKYGRRSAFIRPSKDGQYDYLSSNYQYIEYSFEPHFMRIASPIDFIIQRQQYLTERDEYIEIHNSGLH